MSFHLKLVDLIEDILTTRVEYMTKLSIGEIRGLSKVEQKALFVRAALTAEVITLAVNQRISAWPLYKKLLFKAFNLY